MDAHTLLQELGFGDYEARAYVSLVGAGTRNGYEVAKAAGMPRANVYAVLERLVERGAARRLDTRDGVRYAAVDPAHLVRHLDARHRRTLAAVEASLASLERADDKTPVFNLAGYEELIDQAQAAIDAAASTLRIAIQPAEAARLAGPLREARERGVAITTLCMEACESECGGCQGSIHRHNLAPAEGARWLILVGDEHYMLAGEITATGATAVATKRRLVVELAGAYIRQSLALATVAGDLGDKFHGLLSRHAREVLGALQSERNPVAWITGIENGKSD